MDRDVRRELRQLRVFAHGATGLLVLLTMAAFSGHMRNARFEEIDVERINIVERSGQRRLVISNKERSPGPMERGVAFGYAGGGRPGLIYYNDEQSEAGGLVFAGSRDSAGKYSAGGNFTFDQYEQDQAVALSYNDANGRRSAGLTVAEFPTHISSRAFGELWRQAGQIKDSVARNDSLDALDSRLHGKGRLFAGRREDGSSQVVLYDATGSPRLRLRVDSAGPARLEFLDANGHVTRMVNDSTIR
jgi:hypothetical protein